MSIQCLSTGSSPKLQSKTVSPQTYSQTITADSGYDGLNNVIVNAVNSTQYVYRRDIKEISEQNINSVPTSYLSNNEFQTVNFTEPRSQIEIQKINLVYASYRTTVDITTTSRQTFFSFSFPHSFDILGYHIFYIQYASPNRILEIAGAEYYTEAGENLRILLNGTDMIDYNFSFEDNSSELIIKGNTSDLNYGNYLFSDFEGNFSATLIVC